MSSEPNRQSAAAPWKAEEAIAGNAEAIQALRELICYPLMYSREARVLGLKVSFYFPAVIGVQF